MEECYIVIYFFHICDVQILVNFASKIAKLVEITLRKTYLSKNPIMRKPMKKTKHKLSFQKNTIVKKIIF